MKEYKCTQCGKIKPENKFNRLNRIPKGRKGECKKCESTRAKNYSRTKRGLLSNIYRGQVHDSKRIGREIPKYTKEEFFKWVYSQPNFEKLYNDWVKNDYNKWWRPSIDRLDNSKTYSFDNIRLVTWAINCYTAKIDVREGRLKSNTRECRITTPDGKEYDFPSVTLAAKHFKFNVRGLIKALKRDADNYLGKYKTRYLINC